MKITSYNPEFNQYRYDGSITFFQTINGYMSNRFLLMTPRCIRDRERFEINKSKTLRSWGKYYLMTLKHIGL